MPPQFHTMSEMIAWMRLGSAERMAFLAAPDPPPAPDPIITVTGNNQVVPLTNATNTTVIDHGTGTLIELFGACQITVENFGVRTGFGTSAPAGADHTGRVIFEDQGVIPILTADGNGGVVVHVGAASADFPNGLWAEKGQLSIPSPTSVAGPDQQYVFVSSA